MEVVEQLRGVLEPVLPQLQTLGALIAANLILGVAVAIKNKEFEFAELGRFFQSEVVPKFFGWAAAKVVVDFAVPEQLGDGQLIFTDVLVEGAFYLLAGSLIGDILGKFAELGIGGLKRIPGIS